MAGNLLLSIHSVMVEKTNSPNSPKLFHNETRPMLEHAHRFYRLGLDDRLGNRLSCLVKPTSPVKGECVVFITLPKGAHYSVIAKNVEYIAQQLRQFFASWATNLFSLVELRNIRNECQWYGWNFKWLANTPLEAKDYRLAQHQKNLYLKLIEQSDSPQVPSHSQLTG